MHSRENLSVHTYRKSVFNWVQIKSKSKKKSKKRIKELNNEESTKRNNKEV